MKPLSIGHSALLTDLATCLNWYRLSSPGLYCCVHPTLELTGGLTLVPGVVVMVNHGARKQATPEPEYERFRGAPNFIADVFSAETSDEYANRKQQFCLAGVTEYLAVFDTEPLTWHWNSAYDNKLELLTADEDGVIRSAALPGLWIQERAFASRDWWTVMSTISRGMTRRGHHDFMHAIWHPEDDQS